MKYKYKCVEQHLYHEDIGHYTSYGIVLEGDETVRVDDVNCDKDFVTTLVFLLNHHQAHPVHLADIVEDYIA